MYHYQLVTVKETHSVIDREKCTPVVYITHRESEEDEEIISQCITLTEKVIQTMGSDYYVPSHLLIQTKHQIFPGDSFYIALSVFGKKSMFFVSLDTFFKTTQSNLENKMKEIEEKLSIESDTLANDYFFDVSVFYEIFDEDRLFCSEDFFHIFKDVFLEDKKYIRHEEPLLFPLGNTSLLLLTNEDIDESKMRILEVDESGFLKQTFHLPFDKLLEKMKEQNYTLQHFIDARNALHLIKDIQLTPRYF